MMRFMRGQKGQRCAYQGSYVLQEKKIDILPIHNLSFAQSYGTSKGDVALAALFREAMMTPK